MRMVEEKVLRVACYARFSSDIQKDRSIEDQFAELEKVIKRFGFKSDKRHYYADRGVSAGSLFDRPGLTRDLLGAASRGEFDAVLVEATDRLARKQADTFYLADRFKFYNIKTFTPSGEVSDLQLTFEGYGNEDFIRKLSQRVKRGHNAITKEGKFAGGYCYGYDTVPETGERTINGDQAKIINRIFCEYSNRITPRKIAAGLEHDGILSPSGRQKWNWQAIVGSEGLGLLHHDLYRGKLVRNRTKKVKDPDTGKYLSRKADADDLVVIDVPHLRIIADGLWDAAHAVRQERRAQMNPAGTKMSPTLERKPHPILGLIKCASCGGKMTSATKGVIACSNARNRGTCDHTKTYKLEPITTEVIAKVDKELTDPEFLKRRVRARALELAKAEKEDNEERDTAQRQLDRLNLQIPRLVDALADGDLPLEEIKAKIRGKEAERAALRERLRLLGAGSNVLTLPDATMSAFGKSVETLVKLLRRNPDDPACRLALANIIDCVQVHPTPKKRPYELSLFARVSAIGNLDLFPAVRSHDKIIAEEGLRRNFGFDNAVTSALSQQKNGGEVILLSRWRIAA